MNANQREIAKTFITQLSTGKVDGELVTPDFQAWSQNVGLIPGNVYLKCVEAVAKLMVSGLSFKIIGITSEQKAGRVAVEAAGDATLPDGSPYEQTYHFLLEFKNGRIALCKEYVNTAYAINALYKALFAKIIKGEIAL